MQEEFEVHSPFFAEEDEESEHPKKVVSDDEWVGDDTDGEEDEDEDSDKDVDEDEEEV